jgi:hypothetical protein
MYQVLFRGKPPIVYFGLSRMLPEDAKRVPEKALFNKGQDTYYRKREMFMKPGTTFETEKPEYYTELQLHGTKGHQYTTGWPEQFKNLGEVKIPEPENDNALKFESSDEDSEANRRRPGRPKKKG